MNPWELENLETEVNILLAKGHKLNCMKLFGFYTALLAYLYTMGIFIQYISESVFNYFKG